MRNCTFLLVSWKCNHIIHTFLAYFSYLMTIPSSYMIKIYFIPFRGWIWVRASTALLITSKRKPNLNWFMVKRIYWMASLIIAKIVYQGTFICYKNSNFTNLTKKIPNWKFQDRVSLRSFYSVSQFHNKKQWFLSYFHHVILIVSSYFSANPLVDPEWQPHYPARHKLQSIKGICTNLWLFRRVTNFLWNF